MGHAPPRIPPDIRREAVAAAEATSNRGWIPDESSFRKERIAKLDRFDAVLHPSVRSPAQLRSPAWSSTSGGSPCNVSSNSGGFTAPKRSWSPSPSPSQKVTRSAYRATSCPPITRRVSLDSRMVSRPRYFTEQQSPRTETGDDGLRKSAEQRGSPSPDPRSCKAVGSSQSSTDTLDKDRRGDATITAASKPHVTPIKSAKAKSARVQGSTVKAVASATVQAEDAKLRFEVLRRKHKNRCEAHAWSTRSLAHVAPLTKKHPVW